ncbi:MAG: hypothetical protein OEX12_03120 [Gammaproteobacteria bacterium]|nr:hypothetical protein [Gammaproteobacteria bacterium]
MMNSFFLKALPYTLLFLLSACGAGTQDGGTSNNISGLAVDGYLAGSKVYIDINGNAKLDSYEHWAITDVDGLFGIARDGTDYCASTTTQRHCLSVGEYSGYDIRIEGGYDTITGEAFEGVISRTLDGTTTQITSALSSMQSSMSAAQITVWLNAENLAASTTLATTDLSSDPLSIATTTGANQTHLIQTAWLVHKSVTIMAAELKRIYPDTIIANESLPNDFAPFVYEALITTWSADTSQDMVTMLADAAKITAIMSEATTLLQAALADAATLTSDGTYTAAVDIPLRISKLITLIDSNLFTTTGYTPVQIYARARAIEILTIMLSEPTIIAANIDAATTDMSLDLTLSNFENVATDVSAIAADYIPDGIATTDYSGRTSLADVLPADPSVPIPVTNSDGDTADVFIDTGTGTVSIDMVADVDGDGIVDDVVIPGTIEPINEYTSIMTLEIGGSQQTIIVETGPAGELIFDTSSLEGLGVDDLGS